MCKEWIEIDCQNNEMDTSVKMKERKIKNNMENGDMEDNKQEKFGRRTIK